MTEDRYRVAPWQRPLLLLLIFAPVVIASSELQWELTHWRGNANAIFDLYFSRYTTNVIQWSRPLARWVAWAIQSVTGSGVALAEISMVLQPIYLGLACIAVSAWAGRFVGFVGGVTTALLVMALLPFGAMRLGYSIMYPYDNMALMMSAVFLWLWCRGNTIWATVWMVPATLCKETTLWLVFAALFHDIFTKVPLRVIAVRIVPVGAAFVIPYAVIRFLYRYDSKGLRWSVPLWSKDHSDNSHYFRVLDNWKELGFGGFGTPMLNVYWPLLIYLAIPFAWRGMPSPLRGVSLATLPFFACMLVMANIWEVRVFHEVLPVGALAAVLLMTRLAKESRNFPDAKTR